MSGEVVTEAEQSESTPRIMRTPRTVDLEITSRCNLRCRYCYFFDNPDVVYRDLPTDEWLKFFDELGQCAVMETTLQGGEPFFRKDLPELINGIVRNGMRFSILSNGGLIDDKIAAFIAETGRCNYVQVSIDGSCPETHDACRGTGSFEGAVRGVRILQRHGINAAVRVTIHRQNVHDLDNTARFLLEDLGINSFGTNAASYFGSCRQNSEEVMLTTEERMLAMEALLRLSEKYEGRISAQAGPLAEARHWRLMEQARAQGAPAFARAGSLVGCGCIFNKLTVRADGMIVPCTMLAHMELGRINQDSLADLWQQHPLLADMRQRHKIPLTDFEFCAGCPYIPYCTGSCPGLAYTIVGQVNHPSPDACLRRFLEDGGRII